MRFSRLSKLALYGGTAAAGAVWYSKLAEEASRPYIVFNSEGEVPARAQQLAKLHAGNKEDPFDVLIIGGGATGAGCAVDAATRWPPYLPESAVLRGVHRNTALIEAQPPAADVNI